MRNRELASYEQVSDPTYKSRINDSLMDKALMTVMFLLLVPIIGYAIYLIGGKPKTSQHNHVAPHGLMAKSLSEDSPYAMAEKDAFHLIRKALDSTTETEISKWFMPSQFLTTGQVLDWVRERSHDDGTMASMQYLPPNIINSQNLEEVLVHFKKGELETTRTAHLLEDEDGHWKIDFDSFARLCVPSFEEVASGYSGEALLRVSITPDHYYNGAFPSDDEWQAFKLRCPDDDRSIMAYIEIGSSQHRAMLKTFLMEKESYRVTLLLERRGDPSLNQYKINRILSDGWYVGKNKFESD